MKARLNVLGRKLEVVSISYHNGGISSVMTVDENGRMKTYYDTERGSYPDGSLIVDMKVALEFPDVATKIEENNNKIIERLQEIVSQEKNALTNIAIDAMEGNAEKLPFGELTLVNAQKEYKLSEQYLLGVIDALEDVKAFTEGFYTPDQHIELPEGVEK